MKPIRTPDTQFDYKGPTPDIGDLPCHRVRPGFILSEWDLTKAERIAIARGARIELGIHTEPIPPVQLNVVERDAEGSLSYVDEHGPWEQITPDELAGFSHVERSVSAHRASLRARSLTRESLAALGLLATGDRIKSSDGARTHAASAFRSRRMSVLGDRYRVTEGYDRLDAAAAQNAVHGAHLWILLTTYGLTDEEAAVATEGIDQLLDRDHLLAVTTIGCYLCEQPYREVVGKPCKGQPTHYASDGTPKWSS